MISFRKERGRGVFQWCDESRKNGVDLGPLLGERVKVISK